MSGKRYTGRGIFVNDNMSYQESFFENRDIKQLVQYETARFYYPTVAERQSMSVSTMTWTATSKLGKPVLWRPHTMVAHSLV